MLLIKRNRISGLITKKMEGGGDDDDIYWDNYSSIDNSCRVRHKVQVDDLDDNLR